MTGEPTSNPVIHELKCWPEYFGPILDSRKTFEVRKNDRGFKYGHVLHLREWKPQPDDGGYYTGRETHVRVLGVYSNLPGVREGHVVMSLGNVLPDETERRRLTGLCDLCKRTWMVDCDPRTEVMVMAFHCPCGHKTRMDGDEGH